MREIDYGYVNDRCKEELYEFLSMVGATDVVVGLSGGIDSSVVAALAVEALGSDHVLGVLMPGPYSSESSLEDAHALASNLSIRTKTIPISSSWESFVSTLEEADVSVQGITSENIQARCRMIILMAISNSTGAILLNTGNLSESYTGYSTLYGDTAGAFAPIGGLYKTEVYKLAEFINAQAKEKGQIFPIPQNVIDKPPSAELSDGQNDEGSLGVPYETLDQILCEVFEGADDADMQAIMKTDVYERVVQLYGKDVVTRVQNLYEASEFKREIEPPFPSFG